MKNAIIFFIVAVFAMFILIEITAIYIYSGKPTEYIPMHTGDTELVDSVISENQEPAIHNKIIFHRDQKYAEIRYGANCENVEYVEDLDLTFYDIDGVAWKAEWHKMNDERIVDLIISENLDCMPPRGHIPNGKFLDSSIFANPSDREASKRGEILGNTKTKK